MSLTLQAPQAQQFLTLCVPAAGSMGTGLQAVHDSVIPLYVQLLEDFGVIDHYLIDGTSLLLHLLDNRRLDWQHGGQFLQLFHMLEQLLCDLKRCNAEFKVIFFQQACRARSAAWGSSLQLAMQLMAQHLEACGIQVGFPPTSF